MSRMRGREGKGNMGDRHSRLKGHYRQNGQKRRMMAVGKKSRLNRHNRQGRLNRHDRYVGM